MLHAGANLLKRVSLAHLAHLRGRGGEVSVQQRGGDVHSCEPCPEPARFSRNSSSRARFAPAVQRTIARRVLSYYLTTHTRAVRNTRATRAHEYATCTMHHGESTAESRCARDSTSFTTTSSTSHFLSNVRACPKYGCGAVQCGAVRCVPQC